MSLNKFISKQATFTATTLVPKTGYPVDLNSPKFNVSVNNGQYTLQGTFVTSSTVASSEFYVDISLPKVDNLFDPAEIKVGTDPSKIVNHSQGSETLASGATWVPWGAAVQGPGVVRCFLRSDKNNTSGQANFFTIQLSICSLI